MGEKKERGRFTLRFNEGDPIHETAIGLLELQSPRTKAQYVANAVVYYFGIFFFGVCGLAGGISICSIITICLCAAI